MNTVSANNYSQGFNTQFDLTPALVGHINQIIQQLGSPSQALTVAASTVIDGGSKVLQNLFASSGLTAITAAFQNIIDGATITIDYLKTTASNCAITFPAGTIISASSNCAISGTTATLSSTANGRYTITILNINDVYKVYIVQDVA